MKWNSSIYLICFRFPISLLTPPSSLKLSNLYAISPWCFWVFDCIVNFFKGRWFDKMPRGRSYILALFDIVCGEQRYVFLLSSFRTSCFSIVEFFDLNHSLNFDLFKTLFLFSLWLNFFLSLYWYAQFNLYFKKHRFRVSFAPLQLCMSNTLLLYTACNDTFFCVETVDHAQIVGNYEI